MHSDVVVIVVLFIILANQSLEERCLRHAENKEKVLKQKMFNDWRDATNHLRIARAHFEANLVFKYAPHV